MVSHQPGLPVTGLDVGDVLVAGQRVADQHRVGALGVERAVGLVGDLERRELDAGVELQRLVGAEARHQRIARLVRLAAREPLHPVLCRRRPSAIRVSRRPKEPARRAVR